MYKTGDYVFHKSSGLVKKIERQGEGIYSDAWLTDWDYVWDSGIRIATPMEITEVLSQKAVVQVLNC